MTIKRKVLIVQISFALIVLIVFFKGCIKPNLDYFSQGLSKNGFDEKQKGELKQYLNLFKKEAQKQIKLKDSFILRSKHSYLAFNYKDTFKVVVHKVDLKNDTALSKILITEKKHMERSPNVTYAGFDDETTFNHSAAYDSIISNIYMAYDDNLSDVTLFGDSIINYNLFAKSLAFRHEKNGVVDFVFESKKASVKSKPRALNFNVVFYKKNSSVFILVLYPRIESIVLDKYMLLHLLKT
jgi:hypothetical protein